MKATNADKKPPPGQTPSPPSFFSGSCENLDSSSVLFFRFFWTFGCAGNALMCVFMGSAKASETWYASATHKLCNENTRFNLGFIFVAQSFILNILGQSFQNAHVFYYTYMNMFSIQKNRRWWECLGNDDIFLIGNLTCDMAIVTTAVLNLGE